MPIQAGGLGGGPRGADRPARGGRGAWAAGRARRGGAPAGAARVLNSDGQAGDGVRGRGSGAKSI